MRLIRFLFPLLTLFAGGLAHAQIAYHSACNAQGAGVSSRTCNLNPSGSNFAVVIGIKCEGVGSNPSSVTYGAQNATLIARDDNFAPGFWLYYVLPSAGGTQAVTVNYGGTCSRAALGALAFTGVNQSTPIGASNVGLSSLATTHSATVSSGVGQVVVDAATVGGADISVGAGQTARVDLDDMTDQNRSFGMSTEDGAASVTMSWTTSGTTDGVVIAVPLVPAAGGSSAVVVKRRRH